MTTRADVTAYARCLAGLSASPACPATRAAYLNLIAPCETPERAAEMAMMSGCALVALAVLRHFIAHGRLEAPYRTGEAMADLVAIGREACALRPTGSAPQPGDVVIVGGGTDGGGPEHAWTALSVAWDPYEPTVTVQGLDGGQRDDLGYETIVLRDHVIVGATDSTVPGLSRKVRWVLDLDAILARFGRHDINFRAVKGGPPLTRRNPSD